MNNLSFLIDQIIMSLKAPKRRIVEPQKRLRTAFSCDRCKAKKIACVREKKEDTIESCFACRKKKANCKTSLKRSPKDAFPLENIGLHYKCLVTLLEDVYPQENINNIDVLIQLGNRRKLVMPDRRGLNEQETKSIQRLVNSLIISEHKNKRTESDKNLTEALPTALVKLSFEVFKRHEDSWKEKDTHLIDKGGNHHYIGPFGAPSFLLTLTNDIIFKNCYFFGSSIESCTKLFYDTHPIGSERKKYDLSSRVSHFLKPSISKSLADGYLNIFFDKIHPSFFCFNEIKFRDMCGKFWSVLASQGLNQDMISEINICLIYIVWVLGSLFYDDKAKFENDIFLKNSLLVIDYFIPKMLIAPCLESIQCLMLLSIYYEMNGLKESGHVLLELVLSQAGSIGLYRKSFALHSRDQLMAEELILTWWTLFQHAVRVNTQMGRSFELPSSQITIELPSRNDTNQVLFKAAWIDGVKLANLFCPILKYRCESTSLDSLLNYKSINQALEIKQRLGAWYEGLSYANCESLGAEESSNIILYHYYMLSISFPFLLTITKNKFLSSTPIILLELINLCFESSYKIFQLAKSRERLGHSNGLFSPDVFFVYNAVLCLVTCDIWLKQCEESLITHEIMISDYDGPIDRPVMNNWFKSLKLFNDILLAKSRGTQLTVCTFTSVFLEAVVLATDSLEKNSIEDFLNFWREETATHSFPNDGEAIFRIEDFV